MRWLIFLSKVGFFSGVMLLVGFTLLVAGMSKVENTFTSIVLTGFAFAIIWLPFLNLLYLVLAIAGKRPGHFVPKWLMAFNIFCLFILAAYILYINGLFNY